MMKVIKEHVTEVAPNRSRERYEAKMSALKEIADSIKIPLTVERGAMPNLDVATAYRYADTLLEITEWLVATYIRDKERE